MKNFIIAKAIFIIIAGLVGSYFIIKSDDGIKLSDEKSKKENIFNKFSNLIEENPIQWMKDNFQIENFGDKGKHLPKRIQQPRFRSGRTP